MGLQAASGSKCCSKVAEAEVAVSVCRRSCARLQVKDGLWHMDQALFFLQLLTSGLALLGHLGCCGVQVRLHVIYIGLQVRKV